MSAITSIRRPSERVIEGTLPWINAIRAKAVDCVDSLTVPTTRDEEWRFTDISQLTKMSFQTVRNAISLQATTVEHFYLEEAITRLVFVDGVYAPHLSSPTKDGVLVTNLSTAVTARPAAINTHLGQHAEFLDNYYAAVNTASLHDVAVIVVPCNVAQAAPVHLLFIATQTGAVSSGFSAKAVKRFILPIARCPWGDRATINR